MTIEGVRKVLADQFKTGTAKEWAQRNKISAAYVSDVLQGRRDPGSKILKALGLEVVKDYRRLKA